MSEIVFLVEEVGGVFIARAVGESVFTNAVTMEGLRLAVREAVKCHFEDGNAPKTIRLRIVREETLTT